MTPLELYQRKNLNPLWYRQYLKVLPQWATTIEPWFTAAQTGDMKLLEDLLSVANPPEAFDEETEELRQSMIDGLSYYEDVSGIIHLALDTGHFDIAGKLGDRYYDLIRDQDTEIILRLALVNDDFLRRYIPIMTWEDVASFRDLSRNVLTKAYNKQLIGRKDLESILEKLFNNAVNFTMFAILLGYLEFIQRFQIYPEGSQRRAQDIKKRLCSSSRS